MKGVIRRIQAKGIPPFIEKALCVPGTGKTWHALDLAFRLAQPHLHITLAK